MRDLARHLLVDAYGAKHGMHLTLHLSVTRAEHARLGRSPEKTVVVALRLRRKETTNAHRYRACDKLRDAPEHDELGLAKGRQARCEREWDSEAVRETDDAVGNISGCLQERAEWVGHGADKTAVGSQPPPE